MVLFIVSVRIKLPIRICNSFLDCQLILAIIVVGLPAGPQPILVLEGACNNYHGLLAGGSQ